MGSLLSSPGKQAQQAAAASGAMSQQEITQLQQYDQQQRDALRSAISGMGANPYFAAGADMSTQGYQVNPADTVASGSQGPGTYTVAATSPVQANPYPVPQSTNPNPKPPTSQPTTTPTAPATPPRTPISPVQKKPEPGTPTDGTTSTPVTVPGGIQNAPYRSRLY